MIKLSVIIPVYNVEKYLRKCIDSVVKQNMEDMEIIIVNDGSQDHSQDIIDEYSRKYEFVKVFIKENGGLSDARNYGIEYALGKYIAFVDSDDYIDSNMYREMYNKAEEEEFDLVVCDFEEIYDNRIVYGTSRIDYDLNNKNQVKKHMIDMYPSSWNKIYKRELFQNLRFKKNVWFEDVELFYRMLPYVNSVGVIKKPFYKYLQRPGSISKSKDKRIFHCVDNWNGIVDFYKEKGFYKEYYYELEYNYVRYLYATFIKACLKFDYETFLETVKYAEKNVKEKFPNYKKNKYFYKSGKGIYLIIFNKYIASLYYKISNKKYR